MVLCIVLKGTIILEMKHIVIMKIEVIDIKHHFFKLIFFHCGILCRDLRKLCAGNKIKRIFYLEI